MINLPRTLAHLQRNERPADPRVSSARIPSCARCSSNTAAKTGTGFSRSRLNDGSSKISSMAMPKDPTAGRAPLCDLVEGADPRSRLGSGSFGVACRQRGLRVFGLEPDRIGQGAKITSIQIARRRLVAPVFVSGVGEELPFSDTCLDLIVMNQMVEHFGRPIGGCTGGSCRERGRCDLHRLSKLLTLLRAARQGFRVPLLPKTLGRIYLRLRRRGPVILNQLTSNRRLRKLLGALGPDYTVLDLPASSS
jgi:hypothetical protein